MGKNLFIKSKKKRKRILFYSSVESQIKELKDRLLKSRTGLCDLSNYNDIHLICGVVKDFLRSLSESLLTENLWKTFASLVEDDDDFNLSKQQKFDTLMQQLPKPNRDTLAFLILHLQRVASSSACRMPITNLSRTMVNLSGTKKNRNFLIRFFFFFRVQLLLVIHRNIYQMLILLVKLINKQKFLNIFLKYHQLIGRKCLKIMMVYFLQRKLNKILVHLFKHVNNIFLILQ